MKPISKGDHWSPFPIIINLLNEQGLGGPWELAIAKARFTLASTVYPCSNNSPFDIFVRVLF